MSAIIAWLMSNWGMVASILLVISEALAFVFPASTGFGGILAGIVKFLQSIGTKPPSAPSAPAPVTPPAA